jgi:acetyl-CoA acyltransferase 1
MAERLNQLKNQITNAFSASSSNLLDKHPDDVPARRASVCVDFVGRHCVCAEDGNHPRRKGRLQGFVPGGYARRCSSGMALRQLYVDGKGVVKTSGINPALIEDIAVGTVLTPAGGASVARAASLIAGIPNTAGLNTVNRQCSSGLMAVVQIAHEIQSGMIDIGIGGGMESMTKHYGPQALGEVSDAVHEHHEAKDVLIPMGYSLSELITNRRNYIRECR